MTIPPPSSIGCLPRGLRHWIPKFLFLLETRSTRSTSNLGCRQVLQCNNGIRCLVLIQKNKSKKIPLCHKSLRMCEYRVYLVFNTWNRRCYTRQPLGWTLGSTPQHPQTPLLSPWITPRKYKQHHRLSPLLLHPPAPPPAALLCTLPDQPSYGSLRKPYSLITFIFFGECGGHHLILPVFHQQNYIKISN